jgi:hypothetical protein
MSDYLSSCEDGSVLQGLFCNYWGVPWLHGLTFNPGTEPDGLRWETITKEIDLGHPVLFVWDYPENGTDDSSPVGLHELVITGYSDDTGIRRLQIWDPWPVPTTPPDHVPACGPANGVQVTQDHSRQIDFSTYGNPMNDMGLTAVHAQDQWGLAKDRSAGVAMVAPTASSGLILTGDEPQPAPRPAPKPFHKLPHPPSQPAMKVSFAKALSAALPEAKKLDLQVPGAAPRSLGVPFPIIGLGFKQLLSLRPSDDPTRLLTGTTSAILFPVESQDRVVDAFLMLLVKGRWQRGGYANLEITRRLVDLRARFAEPQHPPESFYMVSVPGEVAFFAAHGTGNQAVLIPVSTDRSIGATAGEAVRAGQQLKDLIQGIQTDLRGHPRPGGREFVRPAG